MLEVDYLTDKNGHPKAVMIPIELWRQILPRDPDSTEDISEAFENYCLNKAMDEAKTSPLLNRKQALDYLEEE